MFVVERSFKVNGYTLASKEWNSGAKYKVIACHGWLDNAASFDVIAPMLSDFHIIALDMPGHGQSDHKSPQATYNIWDDLLDILAVADEMDWETFNLLGHSRGAMMATLLASVMPERVESLVMLDAFVPQPTKPSDAAKNLRNFIRQNRSALHKKFRRYKSIDEAIKAKSKANNVSYESAKLFAERSLKAINDDYFWSNDPRLIGSSAVKMTQANNEAFIKEMKAPYLLLLAEDGITKNEGFMDLIKNTEGLKYTFMQGGHHFHMEKEAADVASAIKDFYSSLS